MTRYASRRTRNQMVSAITLLVLALVALLIRTGWDALQAQNDPQSPETTSQSSQGPTVRPIGPQGVRGIVKSVYDGDTMSIVTKDGEKLSVRLLGIDAPEMARDGQPAQCGAVAARDRLRELAPPGTTIWIVYDSRADHVDRYQRHLVYVIIADGTDLARSLADEGLVEAWYPKGEPEPERFAEYAKAAAAAKSSGLGSWPTCGHLGR